MAPGIPGARRRRVKGPTYYGGMCCVDGCMRRQVKGRIYCHVHLEHVRHGCAPFDKDLTIAVHAAPDMGTLADVLRRRNFAGWKPNQNRNREGK